MIKNNFRLESGHEYSLKQLLNGKNKIVIPDLQRDYCWGDKAWNKEANNYTELVSGFMDSLLSVFNENSEDKLTLGLIYGYENPHYTIQLCDGQQRLTTLFLLMGMINRKTDNNRFKDILISEAELADDREPNLLYSIRESTLYFLSDLVCEFFLNNGLELPAIKKMDWYFKEYGLDASIQSMLNALRTIDMKLINIDCDAFGEFIANNLQMLFYDMGHRTRGEETFVVINTTGEPLTATENLKPILIGNIKDNNKRETASTEWEDREEWFWKNRKNGPNKQNKEQTSDNALKDFLIWYWQIRLLQEKVWKEKKSYTINPNELFQKKPIVLDEQEENPDLDNWEESINLETVHKYFSALELLVKKSNEENINKVLKTISNQEISLSWFRSNEVGLDVVLPLIEYLVKFNNPQNLYQFVRRIRKNYFDKQFEDRKENYMNWRYIVQIIRFSDKEEDVLRFESENNINKFRLTPNIPLNEWYNDDEKRKDSLKIEYRNEVEQWEDHDELNGDLSILWQANGDNILDYNTISQFYQTFRTLSECLLEENSKANLILSNFFRLYKLLIGYPAIGQIYYCSSDIKGAWFSKRDIKSNDFIKYLSDEKIISLIRIAPSKLKDELETRIRTIVNESAIINLNDDNFSATNHLKAWIFVKVLYSNSKNTLLAFYDGSGIASYVNCNQNKLNKDLDFSIANSICGYAIRNPANRIDYATDCWDKIDCFDTTIGKYVSLHDFTNREKQPISKAQITSIANEIKVLVDSFLING